MVERWPPKPATWVRFLQPMPMQMSYSGYYSSLPRRGYGFDPRHLLHAPFVYGYYPTLPNCAIIRSMKVKGGSQFLTYGQTHYQRNRQVYLDKMKQRRKELRAFVRSIKEKSRCVDCGMTDWRCLDFDHRSGTHKIGHLSQTKIVYCSKERILAEIAKCDVRCANCHRIKTLERAGVV